MSLTIIGCGISPDIYNSVVTERNAAQNTIVQLEKSQVDNENTITLLQNSNKELTELLINLIKSNKYKDDPSKTYPRLFDKNMNLKKIEDLILRTANK